MIDLYDDQHEFINEIRKLWPHHKRIIGKAATGFGKTRCAAFITEGLNARGMTVCFVVPRISLIEQTAKSFTDLGIDDITYLWADHETDFSCKVIIASIDTLIRRQKVEADLFIIDEAQHKRKQLLEWMDNHPDDRYLGLSATPYADWMGQYYTAMAKSKPMRWLIENGRLAPYDTYAPFAPSMDGVKTIDTSYGKDYRESELERVMGEHKLVADIVTYWLERGENRLSMALCVNVSHANALAVEFQQAGVSAEVITAHVPVDERHQIFTRMREGATKIVLSVNCLTEGFDLPEVTCLINARPTKSKARWQQGAGRVLRYLPGKRAVIFDHAGTAIGLGLPCEIDIEELDDSSDGLSESPGRNDGEDKKEKKAKKCPQCKYMKPAGVVKCPKCGHKPLAGDLVDTDNSRSLKKIGGADETGPSQEEMQDFYSQLKGYQRERGNAGKPIKDGWVNHKFKEKFGGWPNGMKDIPKPAGVQVKNWIKSQYIRYAKGRKKSEQKGQEVLKELLQIL